MQKTEGLFKTRTKCPACDSASVETIFGPIEFTDRRIESILKTTWSGQVDWEYLHNYLASFEYCLEKCVRCTLIWQRNVPNHRLLDVIYEDLSSSRIYKYSVEDFERLYTTVPKKLTGQAIEENDAHKQSPFWQEIAARRGEDAAAPVKPPFKDPTDLIQQISLIRAYFGSHNIKVLDFGMGEGKWCRLAAIFGFDTYGLEYSEEKLDLGSDGGYKVITHKYLADHHFDLINARQVFEHLNEPLDTLKQLVKSLNPGGMVRISVPNGHNIENKISDKKAWTAAKGSKLSLNPVRPLRHVNCFTGNSMTIMAKEAGLRRAKFSVGHRLTASVGLRNVMRAPLSWAYQRLKPDHSTRQYYVKS